MNALDPPARASAGAEGRDRKRRGAAPWAICLALVLLGAAAGPVVLAAGPIKVSQIGRHFVPDTLEVASGTVLRIVNDDKVTHHIYVDSPGMQFDSGEQPIGTTVDLRFDRAGSYAVRCAIHPTMHLQVTVK